jgi:hypothetical protein
MNKETKTITQQELIVLLNQVEKSTMVNLLTETEVGMKKTNNPYYKKVIKRSSCNYLIGNDYGQRVTTNYGKEGIENTFEVEGASGKEHISKCVLRSTNPDKPTTYYLMVERFDEIKPKVEYLFEGNTIDKTLFESYMNKVYESQKQECDRKVMVITPKIENIKEMSLNGVRYIVQ